jgi:HK97 gp10 family phage protein
MAEVTIKGMDSLERKLAKVGVDAKSAIMKAVAESSLKIESDAKTSIQRGSRTGRIYTRGNVQHQASAPGEAPKTDTGKLVAGISTKLADGGLSSKVGVMSKEAIHGAYLELGTSKVSPRPWLNPALDKNRDFIQKSFERHLMKAIKKAATK